MRALVIGGTGPTGLPIVNGLLSRGYNVTILHTGKHEVEFASEVEHIHAEPNFAESLAEALGSRTFDLIIGMYGRLRHVVEVVKGRTPRFICVTGTAYLGVGDPRDNPDGLLVPIPENAPLYTDYDMNKFLYLIAMSEQAVMNAHHDGAYEATIFRYPRWIYGARQPRFREWCIIKRIIDGRKQIILPNNGLILQTRGYIENMAHAVLLATEKGEARGQIYNVGDDRAFTLRQWTEKICNDLSWNGELIEIPWSVSRPSYPYAEINHHEVANTGKITTELGYKDVIDTDTALNRTIDWCLNNRQYISTLEKYIGDKFDYVTEDRIIAEYRKFAKKVNDIPFLYEPPPHPYSPPKK